MSRYALVKDGAILEFRNEAPNRDQTKLPAGKPRMLPVVVEERPDHDPAKETLSGPNFVVEATRVVERFTVTAKTLAERKAQLLIALANKRWQVETGGVVFGGMTISTDRDTQSIVDRSVAAFADGDITGTIDFKTAAGFVQIEEATMRAVKAAGAQHIQACFTREKELTAAISAAATHAALDAVDINSGWGI